MNIQSADYVADIEYFQLHGPTGINTNNNHLMDLQVLIHTTIILFSVLLLHGETSPCRTQNLPSFLSASTFLGGRQHRRGCSLQKCALQTGHS